jgi:TPR repeat protein
MAQIRHFRRISTKNPIAVNLLLTMKGELDLQGAIWGGAKGVNMANSLKSSQYLIESRLLDAARGDANAYFDLGIAFSTGSGGVDVDLIQAHKWFNLAALGGNIEGQQCRADLSDEMSRDEIAEAQRQARAWIDETARRPAARRFAA